MKSTEKNSKMKSQPGARDEQVTRQRRELVNAVGFANTTTGVSMGQQFVPTLAQPL